MRGVRPRPFPHRDARRARLPLAAAAALIALGGAGPAPAEAAPAVPAGYVSEVLPNGLRVSILADPTYPVVATQLWYHVGAAHEDERSRGLAHLFEHMMFGDTETRDKRYYWELHHRHGGDNNAFTSPDETVYVSYIPPGPHREVIEAEADRMRRLVIDDENLEKEKKIVTEELRLRTENDPFSRVLVAAQKALLGEHPYAFDPSGSREDVAAATVESCRAFYDAYYRPNRAHLVVVGPVDTTHTLATIREAFGGIPAGGADPPDVPPLLGWSYPPETVLQEDLPPVETAIVGYPLPPAGSDDHWALLVLGQLLGGGAVDPFEEDIVKRRRKAVVAESMLLSFRRGGAMLFTASSLPYRRKKTAFRQVQRTLDELSRLAWLDEQSLAAAKRSLRRSRLRGSYFAGARAGEIGTAQWWLGDARLAFEADARIAAVTREQVADVYRKYVAETEPVRLYLKPERVPLLIRLFGWLYPLVSR